MRSLKDLIIVDRNCNFTLSRRNIDYAIYKYNDDSQSNKVMCLKSCKSYKAGDICSVQLFDSKLFSTKEIEDHFIGISTSSFGFRWFEKKYIFNREISSKINCRSVHLSRLTESSRLIFYKHIAYYLYQIENMDKDLLINFLYTLTSTFDELNTVLEECLTEEQINELFIRTGKLFEEMYKSFEDIQLDISDNMERLLAAYNENLSIKKSLFTELKMIKETQESKIKKEIRSYL